MMKQAIQLGYSSHKAETCGLHVHISREAFGESVLEQEASIARLLFFVEKNWNELLKFSRRTNRQLERWAARYGYKDTPKEMMDQAKNHRLGRYTCVNLTNANTIEIRIFRGTLKYNTFLATLQLVNRLCDMAIHLSDAEIHAMSWSEFTSGITEPELIQYLKERRLYLNEPVESEAEVCCAAYLDFMITVTVFLPSRRADLFPHCPLPLRSEEQMRPGSPIWQIRI